MTSTSERCDKREYPRTQKADVRDYAHAQGRATLLRRGRHFERGYIVASHFAEVIAERRRGDDSPVKQLFHEQAERWRNETGHLSSISRMTSHPSYLRIIGLGREGLPLILKELRERPDHWLVALNAITGEDPTPDGANFRDAVAAWIKWGETKGYC
jgi:hypothetical protein